MNQIAQQLKERNIAEYLIYMWQEEDLIRANHCEPVSYTHLTLPTT